jgi:uncharacterized protein (TIGR00730 family)
MVLDELDRNSKRADNIDEFILESASKAYDNRKFLHSKEGRIIRLLAEYLHPEQHLRKKKINNLIIFFGSARSVPLEEFHKKSEKLNAKLETANGKDIKIIKEQISKHQAKKIISEAYDASCQIAEEITKWSMKLKKKKRFYVCSGGGPGMMEAANKGAHQAGGKSVGLNISLPFEQRPNQYITPYLNFEFHYFFMRKLWFVSKAQAIIAFPGGLGTLDELMELLTLRQTKKVTKPMPIILYSKEFWTKLVNFDYLIEMGMINKEDLGLFKFIDTPEEAVELLKKELTRIHGL